MKKEKNLQQLIDGAMEGFELDALVQELFRLASVEYSQGDAMVNNDPPGEVAKDILEDFLRKIAIKIAKATAEAGKVREVGEWLGANHRNEIWDDGWNSAVQEQQQKLKEFFGELYEERKEN